MGAMPRWGVCTIWWIHRNGIQKRPTSPSDASCRCPKRFSEYNRDFGLWKNANSMCSNFLNWKRKIRKKRTVLRTAIIKDCWWKSGICIIWQPLFPHRIRTTSFSKKHWKTCAPPSPYRISQEKTLRTGPKQWTWYGSTVDKCRTASLKWNTPRICKIP